MDLFHGQYDCTARGSIPHGRVLYDYCYGSATFCPYSCSYGYEKSPWSSVVCNKETRRWETYNGHKPCIARKPTTKAPFQRLTTPRTIPTSTRRWLSLTFPTFIPQIPSVWPSFEPNPPFNINNVHNLFPVNSHTTTQYPEGDAGASMAIFAIIMAGIIVSSLFLIWFCTCIVKCSAARRRASTRARVTRNLVILHNAYSPPTQRRSQQIHRESSTHVTQPNAGSSATNIPDSVEDNAASTSNGGDRDTNPQADQNNEEDRGLFFVYIRRLIPIHVLRNPFPPAHTPPEPPPYDAESVPPPAYEETETGGISNVQTPSAPPPPYTIS